MPERERVDDPYRDTAKAVDTNVQQVDNAMPLPQGATPFTDPTTQTVNLTYTVASKGAAVDLAATAAVTIPDDNVTVTGVTYTPAGTQAAPAGGNSRTYVLAGSEGTIATFVFDSTVSAGLVSATPVSFTVNIASIKRPEVLTLASTHGGSGVADPGGTLTVTYTL